MSEEKVLIGSHDNPEQKVWGIKKIDPELGEVLIHPDVPQFPITLMESNMVEALKPYKKIADRFLVDLHKFYKPAIDYLTYEKMCHSSKAIYNAMNIMIDLEQPQVMKDRWRLSRDLTCLGLQADDAYRLRIQLFAHMVDWKRFCLNESDLFWLLNKSNFYLRDKLVEILKLEPKHET